MAYGDKMAPRRRGGFAVGGGEYQGAAGCGGGAGGGDNPRGRR